MKNKYINPEFILLQNLENDIIMVSIDQETEENFWGDIFE